MTRLVRARLWRGLAVADALALAITAGCSPEAPQVRQPTSEESQMLALMRLRHVNEVDDFLSSTTTVASSFVIFPGFTSEIPLGSACTDLDQIRPRRSASSTAAVRDFTPSFRYTERRWNFSVFMEMN